MAMYLNLRFGYTGASHTEFSSARASKLRRAAVSLSRLMCSGSTDPPPPSTPQQSPPCPSPYSAPPLPSQPPLPPPPPTHRLVPPLSIDVNWSAGKIDPDAPFVDPATPSRSALSSPLVPVLASSALAASRASRTASASSAGFGIADWDAPAMCGFSSV